MNLTFKAGVVSACAIWVAGPLWAAESQQAREATAPRIGKYQMMQVLPKSAGGQTSDTHEAWILDTETGRVAICGGNSGACRFIDLRAPAK